MNRIYWLSALVLLGATAAIAFFVQNVQGHYYPLLQIKFPDQTTLTFVNPPWAAKEKCQTMNDEMILRIRVGCPDCQVNINQCNFSLIEPWRSVLQDQASSYDVVHSGSLRIVVENPQGGRSTCEAMAAQIQQEQRNGALCMSPIHPVEK